MLRKGWGFIALISFVLSSCGGGSGGANQPPNNQPPNNQPPNNQPPAVEPVLVSCPANEELVNNTCQCPAHLVIKNDICIDQAESVEIGANYLEPGFPVFISKFGGSAYNPIYMKVGNIDKDPELELIFKAGTSPMYAINHDGSILDGWPVSASTGMHGKILLAQLDNDLELETFSGHEGTAVASQQCELNVFKHDGSLKPGWPASCDLSIQISPAAGDLDNDGFDEIVYFDDINLNVVNKDGVVQRINIPNLPFGLLNNWDEISIADINGDNSKNIILLSSAYTDNNIPISGFIRSIYVLDSNLNVMNGFPVHFRSAHTNRPVIGDVDGDGNKEIIVIGGGTQEQFDTDGIINSIKIITSEGIIEKEINFTILLGDGYRIPLKLADLNGDNKPEILVWGDEKIHALDSNGSDLPGWPVEGGYSFSIGDIDGDNRPDVVTIMDKPLDDFTDLNKNILTIYSHDGSVKNFTATIDYMGENSSLIMPVISDIDLDGRNEVIVIGDYWDGGLTVSFPQIWAFDFRGENHGPVEWGQMFGDTLNSGEYSK